MAHGQRCDTIASLIIKNKKPGDYRVFLMLGSSSQHHIPIHSWEDVFLEQPHTVLLFCGIHKSGDQRVAIPHILVFEFG